ncbi:MAG: twin transmembrane helix small protein [Gammaproteobacteria bacterium]|nr:twin transmembrane helix small protein [Gammaproteobacteria bacterium]
MLFKLLVIALLIALTLSLGSALFGLVKPKDEDPKRVVRNLTWRVILAAALLVTLAVGYLTGQIQPHGLMP